jgi:hypothetical protein
MFLEFPRRSPLDNPSLTVTRYDIARHRSQSGVAMNGLKYILMGMGVMAILVVGSCSMLTYKAVEVAETAAASGEGALDRLEEVAEKRRDDEFYGRAAYEDSPSPEYYGE